MTIQENLHIDLNIQDLELSTTLTDYMPTEFPPENPFDLIPAEFTVQHAVAYMFLNLFQQANQDGFRETMEVVEELGRFFEFNSKQDITKLCAEVILWSQKLRPRELKPSIHDLLWLSKMSLSRREVGLLMGRVHNLARNHEDIYGNVMRFTRHLDCFFMEKLSEPQANPFASQRKKVNVVAVDPEGWTVRHDLATMMLHFNALRDQFVEYIDEIHFQLYMPNWESQIDGTGVGITHGDPVCSVQLLEEVDRLLFPSQGSKISDMARVAQSHENLVGYLNHRAFSEAELKNLFYSLYRTTLSALYLTHEQKVGFKNWLLFWHQHIDLSNLIDVVDYNYEEGRSVFSAIDYPEKASRGRSLEWFCVG